MFKKIIAMAATVMFTLTANAQFEQGKVFIGGALTGLNLSYNGASDFSFGTQAQAGYMVADDWMIYGMAGYQRLNGDNMYNVGAGGRFYIEQNGLFIGANCKLRHMPDYTDVMPGVELGYAFFLSRTVTVEPAVYYDQSLKNHSQYSTVGLKIGVGIYLFND